ncbi:MAG: protein-tyrosine-phosphatase [Bacteroidota bacterium]|nr:protein-tyrosine-phosphatase [Bacteroidota bacterium]
MGEVWGQTAAAYYGVDSVFFFSGGTEATAFNIRAANALKRAGFSVSTSPGGKNPKYFVSPDKSNSSWILYSKKYTDIQNPQQGFCAIMVCSEADKSCPVVPGAVARVSLPLEDPRYYDGTPSEQVKYDETSKQLAREMFFLFDYVKKQMNLKTESSK